MKSQGATRDGSENGPTTGHLHLAAPIIAAIFDAEDPETQHVVTVSERQRPGEVRQSAGGGDAS